MGRLDQLLEGQMVGLRRVRQRKEPRPVHARDTVDIDIPRPWGSKKRLKGGFELGIPIQNGRIRRVESVKAFVTLRVPIGKPFRARIIVRAIDDMGNVVLSCEPLCQVGPRSNKDAGVEPRGGLSKGVWDEHLGSFRGLGLSLTRSNPSGPAEACILRDPRGGRPSRKTSRPTERRLGVCQAMLQLHPPAHGLRHPVDFGNLRVQPFRCRECVLGKRAELCLCSLQAVRPVREVVVKVGVGVHSDTVEVGWRE